MKKTLTIHIEGALHIQLLNSLRVASERYCENARTFDDVAKAGGNGFVTADAAKALARDFRTQAGTTTMIGNFLADMVETLTINAETDDDEEAENPFHPESPEGRAWEMEHGE